MILYGTVPQLLFAEIKDWRKQTICLFCDSDSDAESSVFYNTALCLMCWVDWKDIIDLILFAYTLIICVLFESVVCLPKNIMDMVDWSIDNKQRIKSKKKLYLN